LSSSLLYVGYGAGFTSTKVQILTQKLQPAVRYYIQSFTSTKVQILTQKLQPAVRYYIQSAGTKALVLPVEDAFVLKAAEALYVELECPDPACTPRYVY
jgi:hypothetical protein